MGQDVARLRQIKKRNQQLRKKLLASDKSGVIFYPLTQGNKPSLSNQFLTLGG